MKSKRAGTIFLSVSNTRRFRQKYGTVHA